MTALIVIGVIILIFAFLLNVKARAEIRFYGGELDFKVKYLWFTVFPLRKKEKKPKKDKKRREKRRSKRSVKRADADNTDDTEGLTIKNPVGEDTDETADFENDEDIGFSGQGADTEKKDDTKEKLGDKIDKLTETVEKAKIIWAFSKKWLAHIFKHIYFRDLVIDFTVSGEDAYKAAMNYGSVSAVTYGGISAISALFDTKIKTVDIICDFDGKKSVFDGEVKIALSPGTALKAAFGILFGILKNLKRLKGEESAEEENTVSELHTA